MPTWKCCVLSFTVVIRTGLWIMLSQTERQQTLCWYNIICILTRHHSILSLDFIAKLCTHLVASSFCLVVLYLTHRFYWKLWGLFERIAIERIWHLKNDYNNQIDIITWHKMNNANVKACLGTEMKWAIFRMKWKQYHIYPATHTHAHNKSIKQSRIHIGYMSNNNK